LTTAHKLLLGASAIIILAAASTTASAEDCTGTLPAVGCALDENTRGPLTIDNAVTLTIGDSVSIDHTINGNAAPGNGTILTNSGGITVTQNAIIGGTTSIGTLRLGNTDTWNANANIITINDGSDIDLEVGTGGEILNINSGVTSIVGEIIGNDTDILNIGADANGGTYSFTGEIETITVNVISGTASMGNSLGSADPLHAINISDGATLILNNSTTSDGALDLDGTVSIGANRTLFVNTFTADADPGHITFGINRNDDDTDYGALNVTAGGPLNLAAETVSFNINSGTDILNTQTLEDIVIGNGGLTQAPIIQDNYFLYDFSFTQQGSNLDLNITRQDLQSATADTNNYNSANLLLNTLEDNDDTTLKAIQHNLTHASSKTQFNELLESTQPTVDGAPTQISGFVLSQANNFMRSRIEASYSNVNTITGISAGDAKPKQNYIVSNKTRELAKRRLKYLKARSEKLKERNYSHANFYEEELDYQPDQRGIQVWGQVFGGTGEQSAKDNIDGYDYNTTGISFGMDTGNLDDKLLIGIMGTFADSDADSKNANSTNANIQTYLLNLYGGYQFNNNVFINSSLGLGLSDVTTIRKDVGGTGNSATAEYDGEQLSLFTELGKRFEFSNNVTLTPSITTQYSYTNYEDYTEKGAGGANLTVSQNALHSLAIGPNIRAAIFKQTSGGMRIIPEASLGYQYDLLQDRVNTQAYMAATNTSGTGGIEITARGYEPQVHSINAGLGITVGKDDWQLRGGYNFEAKEDFNAHSGIVRAQYQF